MNILKTVRLYGVLGAKFGRAHRLVVDTPAEATKALCVIIPGFEDYMLKAHLRGMRFAVFKGKENIGKDELHHGSGGEEIRIAPVMAGAKRAGMLQTILGAVLVVAGIAIGYFSVGTLSAVGWGMAKFGAAMMVGGVVQMMAPQAPGLSMRQDPDNKPSYAFGGPVNTTAQGIPVGVLYGEREIGGAIISAGIFAEDE